MAESQRGEHGTNAPPGCVRCLVASLTPRWDACKHYPGMPSEMFKASRWTRGNRIFPPCIEVSEKAVTRHKRTWFSRDEMTINMTKIASVRIKTGMFWSDILIESSGGTDALDSHGHTKGDALRIKELI